MKNNREKHSIYKDDIFVDLDKIENEILKLDDIEQCAVVMMNKEMGQDILVAFAVSEKIISKESFRLDTVLDKYIIPIQVIQLSSLPLNKMGQVDKELLSKLSIMNDNEESKLKEYLLKVYDIKELAVVYKEEYSLAKPIHISDIIDNMSTTNVSNKIIPNKLDQNTMQKRPLAILEGRELSTEELEHFPNTLANVIERASREYGHNGITFIDENGVEEFINYKDILLESEKLLGGLRELGLKPQDHIIFQFNNDRSFIVTFWSCMIGGFIPILMTTLKKYNKKTNEADALYNVWEMLNKPYIITNSSLEKSMTRLKDYYDLDESKIVNADQLKKNDADKNWHDTGSDNEAMMLFTSGSTGSPKGVVQTHKNILMRELSTIIHNKFKSNDISLNWMPIEHVGGIIMFHIKDVFLGRNQIQVKTQYILSKPTRWLDIITKYRATMTWAPNFAFALVNREIEEGAKGDWDLSRMTFILNGGEAINGYTAKKFLKLLSAYGLAETSMFPSWGMSETCSGVVYSKNFTKDDKDGVFILDKQSLNGYIQAAQNKQDEVTFVSLGGPIPSVSIRIVNNHNEILEESIIGKLQIKGGTVLKGYYNNEIFNQESFTEDGWFDTGDLGFIKDGCMAITGRAKDLIIINGVNYNSAEIEYIVEQLENVETSYVAACGVRGLNLDTEQLAIFYCTKANSDKEVIKQIELIKKEVFEKQGINPAYVLPVKREQIPKTNIGKIQRTKLSRQFQEGYYSNLIKDIDILLNNERTIPSWFYKKNFIRKQIASSIIGELNKKILIIGQDTSIVEHTKKELEGLGCHCTVAHSTEESIHILQEKSSNINDIIHFMNYDSMYNHKSDIEMIKNYNANGIYSISKLIKTIKRTQNVRIFVITNNSDYINYDKNLYFNGAIEGYIKSINLELNHIKCIQLDLDRNYADNNLIIVNEIKANRNDVRVIYRNGIRYIGSLERLDMVKELKKEHPIKEKGVYLVTGGLGGVGTEVCKFLLENYNTKLVIVGRSDIYSKDVNPSRIHGYNELRNMSKNVMYMCGDVSDKTFLLNVKNNIEEEWKQSIDGIIHLAGMGNLEEHWKSIEAHWGINEIEENYEMMFAAKAYGTIHLFDLIKDNKEALFLNFSSINGYFGGASFSSYSAAQSFQNSYCQYIRSMGYKNTYCLNWSRWYDIGMGKNNIRNKVLTEKGYILLKLDQAIKSMVAAIRTDRNCVYIGLDDKKFNIQKEQNKREILLNTIVYYNGENELSKEDDEILNGNLTFIKLDKMPVYDDNSIDYYRLNTLKNMDEVKNEFKEPSTEIERTLANMWREILDVNRIALDSDFFELGGNSINVTQLVSKISNTFNINISVVLVFENPILENMVMVLEQLI